MKKIILCLLSIVTILSGCDKKPTSDKDKISYAIGQEIAQSIKRDNLDIDPAMLASSLKDGLNGKTPALTPEEMRAAMMLMQTNNQKKMADLASKNKEAGAAFLAANKSKPNIKTLENGLQYEVLKDAPKGKKATPTSTVTVHYTGTLTNGEVFDSSRTRGTPAEFNLGQVIPGFKFGISLMTEGSSYRLFIPSDLGYGPQGNPKIPPNSVLIFEVELIKVK